MKEENGGYAYRSGDQRGRGGPEPAALIMCHWEILPHTERRPLTLDSVRSLFLDQHTHRAEALRVWSIPP